MTGVSLSLLVAGVWPAVRNAPELPLMRTTAPFAAGVAGSSPVAATNTGSFV